MSNMVDEVEKHNKNNVIVEYLLSLWINFVQITKRPTIVYNTKYQIVKMQHVHKMSVTDTIMLT